MISTGKCTKLSLPRVQIKIQTAYALVSILTHQTEMRKALTHKLGLTQPTRFQKEAVNVRISPVKIRLVFIVLVSQDSNLGLTLFTDEKNYLWLIHIKHQVFSCS